MTRPATYKHWRAVYHDTIHDLGFAVRRRTDEYNIPIDRYVWKLLHRIRRIEARLRVEHEVKDASYCEAVLEMFLREGKR